MLLYFVSTKCKIKRREQSLFSFLRSLTIVGEVLSHVEEGEGHQDVEGPVNPGSAGVPSAPRPQRVDLRVNGPRHRSQALRGRGT